MDKKRKYQDDESENDDDSQSNGEYESNEEEEDDDDDEEESSMFVLAICSILIFLSTLIGLLGADLLLEQVPLQPQTCLSASD